MKNTFYIIVLSLFTNLTIQAQTPTQTVDLFNSDLNYDIDEYFNQYIGTWLYTNGTTSLKVIFKKKYFTIIDEHRTYYTDALVGEYEYIVNGVTIFNTLNNLNINYNTPYDYNLNDQSRMPNYDAFFQFTMPRQRLIMRYDEPTNDNMPLSGSFVMHTFVENGQTKLFVNFVNDYAMGMNWSKTNVDLPATTTQLTLPEGEYIFNKVN
jgi:hypothetical protein